MKATNELPWNPYGFHVTISLEISTFNSATMFLSNQIQIVYCFFFIYRTFFCLINCIKYFYSVTMKVSKIKRQVLYLRKCPNIWCVNRVRRFVVYANVAVLNISCKELMTEVLHDIPLFKLWYLFIAFQMYGYIKLI